MRAPVVRGSLQPVVSKQRSPHDRVYVISNTPGTWGQLAFLQECGLDTSRVVDGTCFAVLEGRSAPCPGCPARSPGLAGGGPTAAVIGVGTDVYRLVSARRTGAQVELSMRHLNTIDVSVLVAAKLERLISLARLTARERVVLSQVWLGTRFEDIARDLGISVRTVKFHQANILKKLDVESRVDLMRLLF